jgi:hypothetical protein
MNKDLLENIIKHVLSNFGVIPSRFVNHSKLKSLMSNDFLLDETLKFKDENDNTFENKIWGCQISSGQQDMKILLGDCATDTSIPEYCLLVQLKSCPAYGLYIINSKELDSEPMIACTLDGKSWLECGTYLQATFLAGIEQVKDVGISYSKCSNYKELHTYMLSFLNFHEATFSNG